jgi:thiol-disulfide isomerase/thioredoxin
MTYQQKFPAVLGLAVTLMLILAACSAPVQPLIPESKPENGAIAEALSNNLPADIQITVYQGAGFQPGEETTLSELLASGKPIVLNFWAGLCPPCRLEMPDFQAMYDENKDSVILFGLDVGPFTGLGSNEDGRALLQELTITYPAGTPSDPDVMKDFRILGMPTTVFITPDGEIYETWTGILTAGKLNELIEGLLVSSNT